MDSAAEVTAAAALKTIERLVEAGRADTLHRDLYLQRANTFFAPLLPRDDYLRLKRDRSELDEVLRRSRLAVDRDDWERARDLAVRIGSLRRTVEQNELLLQLGEEVYEPAAVQIDPFSAGIQGLMGGGGPSLAEALRRQAENLTALQEDDPEWRTFYAARQAFFRRFSLPAEGPAQAVARFDPDRLRREALNAVERGDVAHLDSLLARMHQEGENPLSPGPLSRATPTGTPTELAAPFPADATARAERLGLVAVRLEPATELCGYLTSCAWQPTLGEGLQLRDIPEPPGALAALAAQLKELLGLFLLHPFVTSGGTRYLPRCPEEVVLVEDFSEGEERAAGSELLALLGLPRRRGLSRLAIELALLQHGGAIVGERLGLDPQLFRLVCIPWDIYFRLGPERHWGEQKLWTHFDGYQLMQAGGIRALVGGDVRYGGIFDLCSIGHDDEREGVSACFAVVRRERMRSG
jgi:hypothetical protein